MTPENASHGAAGVVAVLRAPVDAAQQVGRLVPGGHEGGGCTLLDSQGSLF